MRLLKDVVTTWKRVAESSSRLAKVQALAASLRSFDSEEIAVATLFLAGEVRQGKIGVGYALLRELSANAPAAAASLTIRDVDAWLDRLAAIRGAGSTQLRTQASRELFDKATHEEREFLIRLLMGELRQGALEGVMIEAIASAANVPAAEVRRASMYAANVGAVAHAALSGGIGALAAFQLQLFSPITPMLAQSAVDVTDALEQLQGPVAFEWKVDGARVQVHKRGAEVHIYTRGLKEVTPAVPEIVAAVQTFPADELILDGEVVALDRAGQPRPFQITMRRFGRKLDVAALRAELPLHAYFFDCLRLEGRSLADREAAQRSIALTECVPQPFRVPRLITDEAQEAQAFYDDALARGHEGVMAKALNSLYEAGNRGASWLKIKRAHTLDLVVLAAEWGHGRRTGWLSNLHLGARDSATGEYVMLGKTFKGLTDEMLQWQTREFLTRVTSRDQWTVHLRPEMVVEVAFNDIQASPQYPGGLALRFARVKHYRSDKTAEQADTIETVRALYAAQSGAES